MKNITTLIVLMSLFLVSCGGGGGSTSSSNGQQTVVEGNKTTITRTVNAESGATFSFQDGVSLEIPANALPSDTAISITKDDKNSLFLFKPDGLVASSPLTLKIPVTSEMTNDSSQVVNVYILSNESPLLDLGTEQIKAEKLVTTLAGNLQEGSTLDVQFSHFSQVRRVIQDPLYLSFFLPSKYLQPGDILTYLSAENYVNNTDGFDWFPGHIAMLTNPNGEDCTINGNVFKCDIVEAMPPKVRTWNLFEGSAYEEGHVYMGARRPKTNTLSETEKNSVVTFSKNQIGKPWAFVNSDEWFSSNLTEFSCVGLVEAAYESIDKGLLNDFSFFDSGIGNPPFPLDMYEVTTPVNIISEVAGNSIEIRVNPIYQVLKPAGTIPGTSLQYGYGAYDDYRNIGVSTTNNFSFTASNLPEGATFDPSTGIFQWNNIPETFANSSHTVTFNLSNSYPTIFGGSSNASISETLKINITEAPVALDSAISGTVKEALNQTPLSDVQVSLNDNGIFLKETSTDATGSYLFENIAAKSGYSVSLVKSGYLTETYSGINTQSNITKHLQAVLQIDEQFSGIGIITGKISNALDGSGVTGLTLNFRKGINIQSGSIVKSGTTGVNGAFNLSGLEAGNYTGEILGVGFQTNYFTVVVLGGLTNDNQNGTINPILTEGETRIVLTWGSTPSDLDSHLTGPIPNSGDRFHIYWSRKGNINSSPFSNLDVDDLSSFGPETVTIRQQFEGVYRYSIHNYSNRSSSNSSTLASSNAQVKVYQDAGLVAEFNVPNQDGTLWTVFEINGNQITPINTLTYESNSSSNTAYRQSYLLTNRDSSDANLLIDMPNKDRQNPNK